MAENGRLSEERLQLIRRFMGEEVPGDEDRPAAAAPEPVRVAAAAKPVRQSGSGLDGAARPSPERRPPPDPPRPPREMDGPAPLVPAAAGGRRMSLALSRPARSGLPYHLDLRWPLAAVVAGAVLGLLIGHSL